MRVHQGSQDVNRYTFDRELLLWGLFRRIQYTFTLGMDPLGLAKFPALVTLGNRATFLLDLEEGPVVVIAGRRAMAFDARLASGVVLK